MIIYYKFEKLKICILMHNKGIIFCCARKISCTFWFIWYNTFDCAKYYLGSFFSSCVSHNATDKRRREPLWWPAAIDVGTYVKRVVIPKATYRKWKRNGKFTLKIGRSLCKSCTKCYSYIIIILNFVTYLQPGYDTQRRNGLICSRG